MSQRPYKPKHTRGPSMPDQCAQDNADARLIAAAPELLQALKDILFFGTVQGQRLENARAIIAKAEGDSND